MSWWRLGRGGDGRHALGAAVTSLPSGPLVVPVPGLAPAPVAVPEPVAEVAVVEVAVAEVAVAEVAVAEVAVAELAVAEVAVEDVPEALSVAFDEAELFYESGPWDASASAASWPIDEAGPDVLVGDDDVVDQVLELAPLDLAAPVEQELVPVPAPGPVLDADVVAGQPAPFPPLEPAPAVEPLSLEVPAAVVAPEPLAQVEPVAALPPAPEAPFEQPVEPVDVSPVAAPASSLVVDELTRLLAAADPAALDLDALLGLLQAPLPRLPDAHPVPVAEPDVVPQPEVAAVPVVPFVPQQGRVELGFRDGSTASLEPDSDSAVALGELARLLTGTD